MEAVMHTLSIPQSVVDRVVARRGREHIYDALDPAKTALLVVDMQNAFMLPGVAHALCPMAEKIVPNVNRLARAVRQTGGTVIWIKTTFKADALKNWSTYFEMVKPEQGAKRVAALTADSKGHDLWPALDVRPDDLIVEKNRFSAFIQGSSNLAEVLRERWPRHRACHRYGHQRVLRVDGARRHDAQFQDHHGHRRQCGRDRPGPQRFALRILPHVRGYHVDRYARDVPRAQFVSRIGVGGGVGRRPWASQWPI
jgi:hypothetical protein